MLRHTSNLLKRSLAESSPACSWRCVKMRKLSTVNAFQQSAASPAHYPPYFSTNKQWDTRQTRGMTFPSNSERTDVLLPVSVNSHSHRDLSLFKPVNQLTFSRLMGVYGQLSKSRLTFLVVLTAMSGVALSPLPTTVPVLLSTAFGTALCSASANTLNQLSEVPFDAQMVRTRTRPLVRCAISPAHAACFALFTGIAGPAILLTFVNPTSAFLATANIGLYAGAYTFLKRTSVINTWVGAVVGAIPPLIGWTACGGQIFPSSTYPIETFLPSFLSNLPAVPLEYVDNPLSALALFCLLFSWQFPHFNSLSYITRESYALSGYKMLSVTNPSLNAAVSLRHAAALVGICSVLTPLSGLTTWTFAISSLVPNAYTLRAAWRFWRYGSEKEAKALWNITLWYLPVILGLMMFHKQGMEWYDISWVGRSVHVPVKDRPASS